jgi:hypothetical protein
MLIGVDMLAPYQMTLDFRSSVLNITFCETTIPIRTKSMEAPVQHGKVKVNDRVIVPPHAHKRIPISFKPFSHDCKFNFLPRFTQSTAYLTHAGAFLKSVCSNKTSSVVFHNKTDRPIIIARNTAVGEMSDFEEGTECFYLDAHDAEQIKGTLFNSAERHRPSSKTLQLSPDFIFLQRHSWVLETVCLKQRSN